MEISRNNSLAMVLNPEDMPAIAQIFQSLEPLVEDWAGIKLVVANLY